MIAGVKNILRMTRRTSVVAIMCVLISVPAYAQFDFFFGRPPAGPPPAQIRPPAPVHPKAKPKVAKKPTSPKGTPAKPTPNGPVNPAPESDTPPPPYDPDLFRLAEILGALTYLNELCGSAPGVDWRAKMRELLEAEAQTGARKERLAGIYNRGFRDYERIYHFCTPNAQAIISRFLAEGGKLAHDVVNRYGAT